MTNEISWIIDFRVKSEALNAYEGLLSHKWSKITRFEELFEDCTDISEDKIKGYFENYTYSTLIRNFWDDSLIKNPSCINVFFLSDDYNIDIACLFSFYLKRDAISFLNQIGLPQSGSINCYLVSYWESSWAKQIEKINVNYLYSLNLFQNIPDIKKRPFDFVFVFKDINSGIGKYEFRSRNKTADYINSKIVSFILHISNVNQEIIRKNKNIDKYCVSFGSSFIYLDAEVLYHTTSKEIADLIINNLVTQENTPWELIEDKPLSEKLKSLEFKDIFNSIKFQEASGDFSIKSFFYPELSALWNWFSLENLKKLFSDYVSQIVYNFKVSKVDFLFETYNKMRTQVDANYRRVIDYNNNGIKTPISIFEEYFNFKPFSLISYRKSIESLILEVEKQKKLNTEGYRNFYTDSITNEGYNPCSMSPAVGLRYMEISNELNDKEGLYLSDKVENQILKIKESAEKIPHPVSLLFKTLTFSTLLVMLFYLPLFSLLEGNDLVVYLILSLLFILPFASMWGKIDSSIKGLSALAHEYEALNKYYITRKMIDYINRSIDSFYDDYINKCRNELLKIEEKIDDALKYLRNNNKNESSYPNVLSVRSAISLAETIPPITISLDGEHFETKDLKSKPDSLFKYFRYAVVTNDLTLDTLLLEETGNLNNYVIDQLRNSSENISTSADLLFPKEALNFKQNEKDELLNLLPPFNNGINNVDLVMREILVDSDKLEKESMILDVFAEDILTSVKHIENGNSKLNKGSISILNINQPSSNIFGLFNTSLGGNRISFVEMTKVFQHANNEKFDNLLNKVIYETIISKGITSTDKVDEVFRTVLRGIDLNFDEDGWQMYRNNPDDLEDSFVKSFRRFFKEKFESILSDYLNSKIN
jgi:hypothetical protein